MRVALTMSVLLALFAFGCGQTQKPELAEPPTVPQTDTPAPADTGYVLADHWRPLSPGEIELPEGALGGLVHVSGQAILIVGNPFKVMDTRPLALISDAADRIQQDQNVVPIDVPQKLNGGQTALFSFTFAQGDGSQSVTYMVLHEPISNSGVMMLFVGMADKGNSGLLLTDMLEAIYTIGDSMVPQP